MSDLLDRAVAVLDNVLPASSDFDLNPGVELPAGRRLRPAGVLVLVGQARGSWSVYLTKRSSALKHHPGQIAFPGGKQDEGDSDIIATALREAHEEIGLPYGLVETLGQLPPHETVTGFSVTPVIARLDAPFEVVMQLSEVDEVFTVPLGHVLDPANYLIQSRRWQGRMRSYYSVPYGPYYVWGATARMLRGWADAIGE